MKLKTLKDLGFSTNPIRINGKELKDENGVPFTLHWVDSMLREEAIKWIKHKGIYVGQNLVGIGSKLIIEIQHIWIKHFFNLTEEDLK